MASKPKDAADALDTSTSDTGDTQPDPADLADAASSLATAAGRKMGLSKADLDEARRLTPVDGDLQPTKTTVQILNEAMIASLTLAQRYHLKIDAKLLNDARMVQKVMEDADANKMSTVDEGIPAGAPPAPGGMGAMMGGQEGPPPMGGMGPGGPPPQFPQPPQ